MTDQSQMVRVPIAPPADVAYAHKLGRGKLIPAQLDELVKAINPAYVAAKQGKSYLAQHQARAEMNRIFGYGNWDLDTEDPVLLYEYSVVAGQEGYPKTGKAERYWFVGYRIRGIVTIRDFWGMPLATYTGLHAEENAPQPNRGEAHALALTSVDSYAMRRAMINLGDRLGLGLYDGGKTDAHGQWTLQNWQGVSFNWAPAEPIPTVGIEPAPADPGTADAAIAKMQGQTFDQARDQVQRNNEHARQQAAQGPYPAPPSPQGAPQGATENLLDRAQARLKVDGQESPMQGDVNGTSREYAQDNG